MAHTLIFPAAYASDRNPRRLPAAPTPVGPTRAILRRLHQIAGLRGAGHRRRRTSSDVRRS